MTESEGMSAIPVADLETTQRVLKILAGQSLPGFVKQATEMANRLLAEIQATCESYDSARKSLDGRITTVREQAWLIFAKQLDLKDGASQSDEASKAVWKLRNDAVTLHKQTFVTSKKLNEIHLDICLELRRRYETLNCPADAEPATPANGKGLSENGYDISRSIVWFIPGLLNFKAAIDRFYSMVETLDEEVDAATGIERLITLLVGFQATSCLPSSSIEGLAQYLKEQADLLGQKVSGEVASMETTLEQIKRVVAERNAATA